MKRMFLALVAMIAATTMAPSASAQRVVREYERVEEHVRIHRGGPSMHYGQRYGGISYGYRGYVVLNLNFGSGGRRHYQSYEPVRYVDRGDCVVRVDGNRPEGNLEAEIERMTDMCLAEAYARRWPQPRVVVLLY